MPHSLNLIFMGTPQFALPALDALHKAGHRIVAVYTQPPRPAGRGQKEMLSPVHQYALTHNLPVYTPARLKDAEAQHVFREHKADAAVVAAYGLLLPPPILEATPFGCINVHPSLLPRWRGAAPIPRTVMAGDKETGIVIMQMDAGLDTGDMLLTRHFTIPDGMTAGELHDVLARMAGPMLLEVLDAAKNKMLKPVKQPETGSSYAHKITKEECRMDWKDTAVSLRNKILGLSPAPGAFFMYKGEAVKVLNATLFTIVDTKGMKPGTVMDGRFTIACGSGALTDLHVQRPGKKAMQAREMLRGYPVPAGEVLE